MTLSKTSRKIASNGRKGHRGTVSNKLQHNPNSVVKMEQVPTTSPAKNGYLDDLFSIFKARQHPFVVVEESALRWMGLRVSPYEVNITSPSPAALALLDTERTQDLDLLIRDSEIEAIKADRS